MTRITKYYVDSYVPTYSPTLYDSYELGLQIGILYTN